MSVYTTYIAKVMLGELINNVFNRLGASQPTASTFLPQYAHKLHVILRFYF